MSPLPSIRNRSGLVSSSSTPGTGREHDPAKFPPSFRISRVAAYNTYGRNAGLRYRGPKQHKPKVKEGSSKNHRWPFKEKRKGKWKSNLTTRKNYYGCRYYTRYGEEHPYCACRCRRSKTWTLSTNIRGLYFLSVLCCSMPFTGYSISSEPSRHNSLMPSAVRRKIKKKKDQSIIENFQESQWKGNQFYLNLNLRHFRSKGAGIESTESKAANIYRRGNIFKVYRFIILRHNNILENTFLFDISIRMDCSAMGANGTVIREFFFLIKVNWKDRLKIDNFFLSVIYKSSN